MNSITLSNSSIINDIMRNLVCCKCKDVLVYPILHCDLGHSFCKKCYDTKIPCFICGYACTGSRNHHLERICESLIYFNKFGQSCSDVKTIMPAILQNDTRPREDTIVPLLCPISESCDFTGTIEQLKFHCVLCHGVKRNFGKSITNVELSSRPGDVTRSLCEAHGTVFLVYAESEATMTDQHARQEGPVIDGGVSQRPYDEKVLRFRCAAPQIQQQAALLR
ncbi:hypothetical protein GWI33_004183 [Rhynchophorus ferrugineus]|uniref:Uncharacterized protein n=1 Tax=Rhynchophorus ferrugineus TaxID=354439 RepID=A0A834IJ59_RHYFE|nr:hypothetical protein GWI33_004183 [Rhynchophorus ferrugineus]